MALRCPQLHAMFPCSLKYLSQAVDLLLKRPTVYQDVVQIGHADLVVQSLEAGLHAALECCWGILQPKGDPDPLIESPGSDEGRKRATLQIHIPLVVGLPWSRVENQLLPPKVSRVSCIRGIG